MACASSSPGSGGISTLGVIAVANVQTSFGPPANRGGWEKRFDVFFAEPEGYARALARARKEDPPKKP
jgi:hypothetical protein